LFKSMPDSACFRTPDDCFEFEGHVRHHRSSESTSAICTLTGSDRRMRMAGLTSRIGFLRAWVSRIVGVE
jgi:hypothetical protein